MGTFLTYLVLSLPYVGAYAMLGLGITVIYQASRVLNLAHGAMAMGAAYFTYQLARWHLPVPVALVGGIAFGGALGLAVERVFVRRLRSSGPTTQTVGTVAVLSLSIAIVARIYGTLPVTEPELLPKGGMLIGHGRIAFDLLGIFPIGVIGALALFALLQFTDIGLAMRGAAQNRRGAALRGVDPDQTTMLAWLLGGAYAALAGIMLSAATTLDPYGVSFGVLPAFVAALIGGLDSMPGVLLGAAIVGVVQGMVPAFGFLPKLGPVDVAGVAQSQGAPQLVLGVLALAVMATRGARLSGADTKADTL
ncbi:MAG: branched-chain amino acid ABC transporter permease [Candidatus Dormibacteria bacterium]